MGAMRVNRGSEAKAYSMDPVPSNGFVITIICKNPLSRAEQSNSKLMATMSVHVQKVNKLILCLQRDQNKKGNEACDNIW
ncbi:hypothetical protein VNO80_17407 [Phaseolus coccineus]|uniref:Uncharacterized protein n=1 Tax=Phaseolus coccineus TaxID=3886 RepID=A0AAN9R2V2_PHACN